MIRGNKIIRLLVNNSKTRCLSKRGYCTVDGLLDIGSSKDDSRKFIRSKEERQKEAQEFAQAIPSPEELKKKTDFTSPKLDDDVAYAYDKAYDDFHAGRYESALKRYYWILSKLPFDCTARLQRASVYEHMGKVDDAIADCNVVLKISNDGEQVAEAYTIKGVCLARKEKYTEAIIAYERSLMLLNNDNVRELKRMAENMLNPSKIVVPKYQDDYEFFDQLSSRLLGNAVIKTSPLHGRGIFATKDIDAEELVFETSSFLSLPVNLSTNRFNTSDTQHCHNCHLSFTPLELEDKSIEKSIEFKKISEMINRMTNLPLGTIEPHSCPGCQEAKFCSVECYHEGLFKHSNICKKKHSHNDLLNKYNYECSKLSDEDRPIYLMMLKMFSLEFNAGDTTDPLRPMELDPFVKRLVYVNNKTDDNTGSAALSRRDQTFFKLLKDIFSNRQISIDMFVRVKSIIALNNVVFPTNRVRVLSEKAPYTDVGYSFDFEEMQSQSLFGLIEHSCFINHSCEPNLFIATPVVNDKSIRFCSSRPIKKGEELFISYIEAEDMSFNDRHKLLKETYGFQCKCSACLSKSSTTSSIL
ncbi:hypothetical protein CYY_003101 [Polysphondylium violaceum]|uniref:SET domain-containing protein n=1 Tax=Polysphondylium violaceum TaxID=133409 RepID=A0A8J4Q781_9MYCE|nr:hypothetical protein CYY_003101 [Polysphondylium violaceum]